jgi:hypothetical protein
VRGPEAAAVWNEDLAMVRRHGAEQCEEGNLRHAVRDVEPSRSGVTDDRTPSHSETSGKRGRCAFDRK